MTGLYATVLLASLAGSLHCVVMCGPLVGLAGGRHSLRFAMVHSLGRLATYVSLGVAAGFIGRVVDLAGHLGAIQHAATIAAASIIVGMAGRSIGLARGWWTGSRATGTAFATGLIQLRSRKPAARAWLTGALTGLLPCGWLWAFVVSAAGTGGMLAGAAVMGVFWLGTVPAMTGVLAVAGPLLDRLRRRVPTITALALVILGLGTLTLRWRDTGASGVEKPSCHEVKR